MFVHNVGDQGIGSLVLRELVAFGNDGSTVLVGSERDGTRERSGADAGKFAARLLGTAANYGAVGTAANNGVVDAGEEA